MFAGAPATLAGSRAKLMASLVKLEASRAACGGSFVKLAGSSALLARAFADESPSHSDELRQILAKSGSVLRNGRRIIGSAVSRWPNRLHYGTSRSLQFRYKYKMDAPVASEELKVSDAQVPTNG